MTKEPRTLSSSLYDVVSEKNREGSAERKEKAEYSRVFHFDTSSIKSGYV